MFPKLILNIFMPPSRQRKSHGEVEGVRLMADIKTYSDHVVVRCKGRLLAEEDMESVARNVVLMRSTPTFVLVDVSQVEAIRSANLAGLWLRFMQANAIGWKLALVRVPDHLAALLRNCGLEDAIPAFDSEDQALQALNTPAVMRARAAS